MSETMIERCARAIFFRGHDPDDMMWQHMQPHLRKTALDQARAAIEAMRNPTAEMVEAGLSAVSDITVREPKVTAWDALRFHRAMIDSTLSQSPISLPSEDR